MQSSRLVIQLKQLNIRGGGVNIGRYGAQCHAITQDEVLIHGGFNKSYLSDTVLLNVKENDAFKLPFSPFNHPSARRGHTLCKIKNQLYLFGGDASGQSQDDCFCYIPLQKQWIQIHSSKIRPLQRYSHSVIVKQSKFIVFGGKNPSLKQLFDDSWYFDCTTNQWNYLTHIGLSPSARYGSMVLNYEPKPIIQGNDIEQYKQLMTQGEDNRERQDESLNFYLFGGVGQAGRLNDLWRGIVDFNAGTIKWICIFENGQPGLPIPRADGAILQLDKNRAILFGGHGQTESLEDFWLIDVGPIQQSEKMYSPKAYSDPSLRQNLVDVRPVNVFKLLSPGMVQLRARSQSCVASFGQQELTNVRSKDFLNPENLVLNQLYANPNSLGKSMSNSGIGVDPLPTDDQSMYNVSSHKFFVAGGLAGRDALGDAYIIEVLECKQVCTQQQKQPSPNEVQYPLSVTQQEEKQTQKPNPINDGISPSSLSKISQNKFDEPGDLNLGDMKPVQRNQNISPTNNHQLLNVLDYKSTNNQTNISQQSPLQVQQNININPQSYSIQKQPPIKDTASQQYNDKLEQLTKIVNENNHPNKSALDQMIQDNVTPLDVQHQLDLSRAQSADPIKQSGLKASGYNAQKIPKELVDFQKNTVLVFQQLENKIQKMQEQNQFQVTQLQQELYDKNKIIEQLKTQIEIYESQNRYLTDRIDKVEGVALKLALKTGVGQDELGIPLGSMLQSTAKQSTLNSTINDDSILNFSNVWDPNGKVNLDKLEEKLQNK